MLEQIKDIKVKGGPFTEMTSLELLSNRLNLLYGRNGSGKSTIAKCIKRLGKEDDGSEYRAETNPCLTDSLQRNVFVFDEDFVSENLRMENEEGLTSIVMIGEQVELDEKLKDLQKQQEVLAPKQSQLSNELISYSDDNNSVSPLWHKNEIVKKLKADGGWADLDKQIRGNQIKSAVKETLFEELLNLKVTGSINDLRKEFKDKFQTLQYIQRSSSKLDEFPQNILFYDISKVKSLFERHIREPRLNSSDKEIIELVRSEYGSYLEHVHTVFDNENMSVCPLCLRPISNIEKQNLYAKIEGFFNRESEAYKQELVRDIGLLQQWKPLEISENAQEIVGSEVIYLIKRSEKKLDILYKELLSSFENKRGNIYGTSSYGKWSELEIEQKSYSKLIGKGNEFIKKYNEEVEHKEKLRGSLIELNKSIAAKELKNDFDNYRKRKDEEQKCRVSLEGTNLQIHKCNQDILAIIDQMKQVNIALDFINEALSCIFFHKRRIVLNSAEGKYVLKSNGRDVKPKDVSTGERNAIALCYFFAKIFENHQKDNRYKDENLIVLDDPVTSFDKDNKVGIMTFLRWQVDALYRGNDKTKLLIMSHDLTSVFQLQKVYNDVARQSYRVCELINQQIVNRKNFREDRNEYKKIMNEVFDIANETSSDFISIGNKMRRMEEAYSSFISNKTFEVLLHDDDFLNKVPEKKRNLFKNLMSRLILNTESHTEEQIYDMLDFTPMFEEEEIKKTARYLLMLFYYVDPFHLKSYLGDNFSVVGNWTKEDE